LNTWTYAYSEPSASAIFKATPEDFVVTEVLGFEPEENARGQHYWLWVEKREHNTDYVARALAKFAGVEPNKVSYSGLKDRQAITFQWFSVELTALAEINWQEFELEHCQIARVVKSTRKLRRGTHKGNTFRIKLKQVKGERSWLEDRLAQISAQGVPNYFGPQRFGRDQHNLAIAESIFSGKKVKNRNAKSMALSAARSWIFNHYLSRRLHDQGQLDLLPGDVMQLMGSQSVFVVQQADIESVAKRITERDVRITGPLVGKGDVLASEQARILESELLNEFIAWSDALKRLGLEHARRPLWLFPSEFNWSWEAEDLVLSFTLEPGAYATSVLREIVSIDETKDTD